MFDNKKIKLSEAKARVKWMKKSKIFTVRAQWNMIKEVENNPLEYYVHYDDKLSGEQLEYLEDEGKRGYGKLIESLWEDLFECELQAKDDQRDEILSSFDASDFKDEYLKKVFEEDMVEEEFDEDEVVEYIKDNFHYLDDVSEEFKDILCDYQTYDFNLDEIFSNNRYDKSLCIELNESEFQELIQEEITAFEKANGLPELYLPDCFEMVYLKGKEINEINEIIDASEAINNELSEIDFDIVKTIELHDDDGEVYDMEIDKTIELSAHNYLINFVDTDEYVEGDYTTIFDMEIYTPTEKDSKKLGYLMTGVAPIGFYGDRDANIQCQVDSFLVIEATFITDEKYDTFGYDKVSNAWMERELTSLDIHRAKEIKSAQEFNGFILSMDGETVYKETAA